MGAVANARYAGSSGQCNGVQFFPQCSTGQYFRNMMQCNSGLYSGYPYRNTGQCRANVDQWIQCMQMNLGKCMNSNCPSYITQFDGFQQFMPIINRFMSVNSLTGIYQAIDGTISDILNQFNIQLPPQLEQFRQRGVKNFQIPLPEYEGQTVDQYITQMICPVPGQMPVSFKNYLPQIQSLWQFLSSFGLTDTTQSVPFCDGDFTTYLVNNIIEHLQGFYRSTTRSQFCSVQKSAANFVDTLLNKKCNYNQLSQVFSAVGIDNDVISMFKNSPQIMWQVSGCASGNQNWQQSNYQQSYSSNNYNNFGTTFQRFNNRRY